jgi:hypothetical protein
VNITRPTHTPERSACAVCGVHDERALSTLKLALGTRVIVCGTHDLVYRRSGQTASTVEELRAIARDRREDRSARRDEGDELGAQLAAAFVSEKRSGQDRRR